MIPETVIDKVWAYSYNSERVTDIWLSFRVLVSVHSPPGAVVAIVPVLLEEPTWDSILEIEEAFLIAKYAIAETQTLQV